MSSHALEPMLDEDDERQQGKHVNVIHEFLENIQKV